MPDSAHRRPPFVTKASIPLWHVGQHARLLDRLDDLFFEISLRQRDTVISGLLLVSARRFLADTYRLVSREPNCRALLRLPPGPEIATAVLCTALRDAKMGLAAFQRNHSDDDSTREDGWLVHEPDEPTY